MLAERVEYGRGGVRQKEHVRLVDLLESADRGTVEHQPVGENLRVERLDRHGEVLHSPRQVTEPDVDELHLVVADELQNLVGVREHPPSLEAAAVS